MGRPPEPSLEAVRDVFEFPMQIRLFARVISGYTAINNDKCGPGATLHPKLELRGGVILPKLGEIAHTRVCVTYAISDTSGP